jgi:hypothetical protein
MIGRRERVRRVAAQPVCRMIVIDRGRIAPWIIAAEMSPVEGAGAYENRKNGRKRSHPSAMARQTERHHCVFR